ncbi:MAG: hypothetical protein NVS1B6_15840 [Steroidobacteraceae bacterium]
MSTLADNQTTDLRARWRHVKRGTAYVEIGTGCLQTADSEKLDDQQVVIYQAETGGQIWVRPTYEFMDGRFERVT